MIDNLKTGMLPESGVRSPVEVFCVSTAKNGPLGTATPLVTVLCALIALIGPDSLGWFPNRIPVFLCWPPVDLQISPVVNLATRGSNSLYLAAFL